MAVVETAAVVEQFHKTLHLRSRSLHLRVLDQAEKRRVSISLQERNSCGNNLSSRNR